MELMISRLDILGVPVTDEFVLLLQTSAAAGAVVFVGVQVVLNIGIYQLFDKHHVPVLLLAWLRQ